MWWRMAYLKCIIVRTTFEHLFMKYTVCNTVYLPYSSHYYWPNWFKHIDKKHSFWRILSHVLDLDHELNILSKLVFFQYTCPWRFPWNQMERFNKGKNFCNQLWDSKIKWGAYSWWSSSLHFSKRNSDQMTIKKTYPTLPNLVTANLFHLFIN